MRRARMRVIPVAILALSGFSDSLSDDALHSFSGVPDLYQELF